MPNYGFKCTECESVFDKNVPMAERDTSPQCPYCDGLETKRTYEPFAIWYQSDREAQGKRAGLNVDRYKAVRDAREKRKKQGSESNELWGQDKKLSRDIGLNDKARIDVAGQHKVEGKNVVNLKV